MTWTRAALAAALLLPAAPTAALAAGNGVPEALRSTVVVEVDGGTGAGFFVAPGQVLTAAHVVAGATTVTVLLGESSARGTVIRTDERRDLALLTVDLDAAPLSFVTTTPEPGSTVFAVGNPLGGGITVSKGIVSGSRVVDGQTAVQTDAAINPGNSGGPLITEDGRVVGVVVSKLRDADGIALAVPASEAQRFVADKSAGSPPSTTRSAPAGAARDDPGGEAAVLWAGGTAALVGCTLLLLLTRRRRDLPAPDLDIVLHPLREPLLNGEHR